MTTTIQEFVLRCLENARGNDTYLATRAFAGMTKEEMQQQHGQSGKTRQQILDSYLAHDAKVDSAIAWIKSLRVTDDPQIRFDGKTPE